MKWNKLSRTQPINTLLEFSFENRIRGIMSLCGVFNFAYVPFLYSGLRWQRKKAGTTHIFLKKATEQKQNEKLEWIRKNRNSNGTFIVHSQNTSSRSRCVTVRLVGFFFSLSYIICLFAIDSVRFAFVFFRDLSTHWAATKIKRWTFGKH